MYLLDYKWFYSLTEANGHTTEEEKLLKPSKSFFYLLLFSFVLNVFKKSLHLKLFSHIFCYLSNDLCN